MKLQDLTTGCILEAARMRRTIGDDAIQEANGLGFDTSTIWYHGTTRRFTSFKEGKFNGELGIGIYLTTESWAANTWARSSGFVMQCFLREGAILEIDDVDDPKVMSQFHKMYNAAMTAKWGEKNGSYSLQEFKELVKKIGVAKLASVSGYIGATKVDSQIPGQIVVWKPENIFIAARSPGQ